MYNSNKGFIIVVYGVVFAGGLSSRMGRNKALLEYGGETLLARTCRLLTDAGVVKVLISGDVPGYESIADVLPRRGPPAALYSTVKHIEKTEGLQQQRLLVVPVDMPGLRPDTLQLLVDADKKAGNSAKAVRFQDQVFPCLFRLSGSLVTLLENGFAVEEEGGQRFSMKAILSACDAVELEVADLAPEQFSNMNTPADWQAFCEQNNRLDQ